MPEPDTDALTAEVCVDAVILEDVCVSRDGRLVGFTVGSRVRVGARFSRGIWIAPADGSAPPRRLTTTDAEHRSLRFSATGDAIWFLANRTEPAVFQLYRLPLDGGEAEQHTHHQSGIHAFELTGDDATRALVLAGDQPASDERPEGERDDAQVCGEDWPLQRLALLDVDTGRLRVLDQVAGHVSGIAAAPDRSELLALTTPSPEPDHASCDADLWLVDVASATARRLAHSTTGGHAVFLDSDQDRALLIAGVQPGGVAGVGLFVVGLQDGDATLVTGEMQACPIAMAAGSSSPLVVVADGLESIITRVEPDGRLAALHRVAGDVSAVAASADTIAFVASSGNQPMEVWAATAGAPPRRLTDTNAVLRSVRLGLQQRMAWTAADGVELDGLLVLPPGRERHQGPFALVTLVHGGPYGRFADELQAGASVWGQWLASAGLAVFHPNPRGGVGHGWRFAASVAGAVGKDDWRDIEQGIDQLVRQGVADPHRLGIGGGSQGGFMSAWAVGQTSRFKAAVMSAGVSDWGMMVADSDIPAVEAAIGGHTGWQGPGPHRHDEISPISYAHRVNTPTLILHGECDRRVPLAQGCYFARALRAHGVTHQFVVYPREPHIFEERAHALDVLRRVRGWFEQYLLDAAAG